MSKRSMAPLTCPQAKRNPPSPMSPLPVPLSSLTGVPASNNYWAVYRGKLVRHNNKGPEGRGVTVVIEKEGEARAVHSNGCFGILVEGGAWFDQARVVLEDWIPGCDIKGVQEDSDENEVDIKPKNDAYVKVEEGSVLEAPKKDDDAFSVEDPNIDQSDHYPRNWGELKDLSMSDDDTSPQTGKEAPVLHLELCEAFYLAYSLGCLSVRDGDSCRHSSHTGDSCAECQLSLLTMWQLYRQLEPDFPLRYRVYHHYRARGWVVRSGYCMGADWGLYKLGPAQYHATYTVRVEGVDRRSGEVLEMKGVKKVTWGDMLAQTRVAVTVKKELLVARVEVLGNFKDWDSPHCLGSMNVTTSRVKRWVVGDQRWTIKPRVSVEVRETTTCDKVGGGDAVIVLD